MFKRKVDLQKLFDGKDWTAVCKYFEKNKKQVFKNPRDMCLVAGSYANLNKAEEAIELLKAAREKHENQAIVYRNLGRLYASISRPLDNYEVLEAGIKYCPNDSLLLNDFLSACFLTEKYSRGLSAINQFERHNGLDYKVRYNKGMLHERLGEFSVAEQCYAQSITEQYDYIPAILNLGIIKLRSRQFREAEVLFKKILHLNASVSQAHYNLGLVYLKLGSYVDADKAFTTADNLRPNNESIVVNKAVAKYHLGALNEASLLLREVNKSYPKNCAATWNLHGLSENIEDALVVLSANIDPAYTPNKHIIAEAILKKKLGNEHAWINLENTEYEEDTLYQEFKWLYSFGVDFKICLNRWQFFDEIMKDCSRHDSFFEFGVNGGLSFDFLKRSFKRSVGFNTLSGLPNHLHNEPEGNYNSRDAISVNTHSDLVVGNFEDTLEDYFCRNLEKVDLINFEANLYNSTIYALNAVQDTLTKDTILIFDAMIGSPNWRKGVAEALLDFCENNSRTFEVIAASYFSKQVAVRIR